jgi:hypothetical protein
MKIIGSQNNMGMTRTPAHSRGMPRDMRYSFRTTDRIDIPILQQ